jgi:hypothetical protein
MGYSEARGTLIYEKNLLSDLKGINSMESMAGVLKMFKNSASGFLSLHTHICTQKNPRCEG